MPNSGEQKQYNVLILNQETQQILTLEDVEPSKSVKTLN